MGLLRSLMAKQCDSNASRAASPALPTGAETSQTVSATPSRQLLMGLLASLVAKDLHCNSNARRASFTRSAARN